MTKLGSLGSKKQAIATGQASKEKVDTTEAEKLLAEWTGKGPAKKS